VKEHPTSSNQWRQLPTVADFTAALCWEFLKNPFGSKIFSHSFDKLCITTMILHMHYTRLYYNHYTALAISETLHN